MIKMRSFSVLLREKSEKGMRDLNMEKERTIRKDAKKSEIKRKKVKRGNIENITLNFA